MPYKYYQTVKLIVSSPGCGIPDIEYGQILEIGGSGGDTWTILSPKKYRSYALNTLWFEEILKEDLFDQLYKRML